MKLVLFAILCVRIHMLTFPDLEHLKTAAMLFPFWYQKKQSTSQARLLL